MTFLRFLLAFLRLGVGETDHDLPADSAAPNPDAGDGAAADGATADGATEGDEGLDDFLDASGPGDAEPDPATALRSERARRESAERELADYRNRTPQQGAPASRDAEFDREEAQLAEAQRNGAGEDQMRWLRWQIDSNRRIRTTERMSQRALAEAGDLNDRTAFEQLQVTKPKTYKQYHERVEKAVADLKAAGQNVPPRMAMLRFMIGDDLMNGKIKPKAARSASADAPAGGVARPRLPNVRSDVSGRSGGPSERDKRRARLDGVSL